MKLQEQVVQQQKEIIIMSKKYYIVYPHVGELETCTKMSSEEMNKRMVTFQNGCDCLMIDSHRHSSSANLANYSDTPLEAFKRAEKTQARYVKTWQDKADRELEQLNKILQGIENLKQEAESK